jgi:hypothetical protein
MSRSGLEMITKTERRWVEQALNQLYEGEVSPMMSAKIMRTVGQIFEQGAKRIEVQLVDKVDERLYNTNTEKQGANYA